MTTALVALAFVTAIVWALVLLARTPRRDLPHGDSEATKRLRQTVETERAVVAAAEREGRTALGAAATARTPEERRGALTRLSAWLGGAVRPPPTGGGKP